MKYVLIFLLTCTMLSEAHAQGRSRSWLNLLLSSVSVAQNALPTVLLFPFLELSSRATTRDPWTPHQVRGDIVFPINDRRLFPVSGYNNDCFFSSIRHYGFDISRASLIAVLERETLNPSYQMAVTRLAIQELVSTQDALSDSLATLRDYFQQYPEEAQHALVHNTELYRWYIRRLREGAPMSFERDHSDAENPSLDLLELLGREYGFDLQIVEPAAEPGFVRILRNFRLPTTTTRQHITLYYHSNEVGHFDLLLEHAPRMSIFGTQPHNLYRKGATLGTGSFSQVYEATNGEGKFAAKLITRQKPRDEYLLSNEILCLSQCASPFIIGLKESFRSFDRSELLIILEFSDSPNLRMALKAQRERRILVDEHSVRLIFAQLLLALAHLHDKNILHRDIKPANILTYKNGAIKLCDFGLSEQFRSLEHDVSSDALGTPPYCSPEIISRKPYGAAVDIWSLGISLYELLALERPFLGEDVKTLSSNIAMGSYKPLHKYYSETLRYIIDQMLETIPRYRPSVYDLIKYDYIQQSIRSLLFGATLGSIGDPASRAAITEAAVERLVPYEREPSILDGQPMTIVVLMDLDGRAVLACYYN